MLHILCAVFLLAFIRGACPAACPRPNCVLRTYTAGVSGGIQIGVGSSIGPNCEALAPSYFINGSSSSTVATNSANSLTYNA